MFQLPRLGCEGPRFESTETATAIVAGVDSPVSHSYGLTTKTARSGPLTSGVCGVRGACSGTQWHSVALCVGLSETLALGPGPLGTLCRFFARFDRSLADFSVYIHSLYIQPEPLWFVLSSLVSRAPSSRVCGGWVVVYLRSHLLERWVDDFLALCVLVRRSFRRTLLALLLSEAVI